MERNEIYGKGYANSYSKALQKLDSADISETNKRLIHRFQENLFSIGCKNARVAKLSSQLRRLCEQMDHDLSEATKTKIQTMVALFNQKDELSDATKSDYRRCIKQFFKWYEEYDERLNSNDEVERKKIQRFYKYIREDLKVAYKAKEINPNTILAKDDIDLVVDKGCKTIKEKAILKFLHETGVRAGELLNIRVGDIKFKQSSAMVTVNGKTGMRSVPIVGSIQYIVGWLEIHPSKDNKESFLWIGENRQYKNLPLKHRGTQKLIDRCFEKADVKKKHNMHWFRHSRATLLAPKLPEALLCKYMGWTLGSDQVKTYVHLCTEQLEDAYLIMNGIKPEEDQVKEAKKCSCCGATNDSIARYCYVCGRPMDVDIAIQDQELVKTETDKTISLMMQIAQDPEKLEAFNRFKQGM
ncbi:tyrosine-type recombinase/integrase [Candidatus Woesearchaeota archaeon]|nr:tyrosine-type recombinase/integrase [Candidatus Woesearchaeota archaeon]